MIELVLLSFLHLSSCLTQSSCYWPDGTLLTPQNNRYNLTPCFEGNSQCCANGEVCLSNGLCFSGPQGQLYRGACTDSTWKTSACPQYCTDSNPDGAPNIVPCPMNSNGQWQYWCGSDSKTNWCKSAVNASLFDYPSGLTVKIATLNNTSNTTCIAANNSEAANAASSIAALQTCTDSSRAQNEVQMMGVKVDTGVGIPLFVIALLLGVLLLLERRSKQKALHRMNTQSMDAKVLEIDRPGLVAAVYELGASADAAELPSKRAALRTKPERSSYS